MEEVSRCSSLAPPLTPPAMLSPGMTLLVMTEACVIRERTRLCSMDTTKGGRYHYIFKVTYIPVTLELKE